MTIQYDGCSSSQRNYIRGAAARIDRDGPRLRSAADFSQQGGRGVAAAVRDGHRHDAADVAVHGDEPVVVAGERDGCPVPLYNSTSGPLEVVTMHRGTARTKD